ncbi:acyltransferase [Methylotuvimicrobium sp.]|uniref:acyltransferase n=1 Tax=Methylotuvimicrobium sp. TaxID=2822413 RepID=UPI003D6600EE
MKSGKDFFFEDVSWEIRQQILMYDSARLMSDKERAVYFGLPRGCRIREGAKIISPENLTIGENCWIGENAMLDASGGLSIGSNTSIGLNTLVWTHDSHQLNIQGMNTPENKDKIKRKATKIGSNCFIGGPSVIMPGIIIGDNCVIAPMSVVYENLLDGTVYRPYRDMHRSLAKRDIQIKSLLARIEALEKQVL